VARLAGGVAHDFNNLLGVIAGYAELMVQQLPEANAHRQKLEQILKASGRAAGLTHQLLAFGRRQLLQPKVLSLTTIVASVQELLRRVIGEDIELEVRSDPDLWPVLADAGQIEQVLMNLAINARDAMPNGGKLIFGLTNVTDVAFPPNGISNGVRCPHVLLTVSDTGIGMDEATRSRLFEPFFTTKDPGKGTGLGLATVYGIVRQSGGHVVVESEPAHGSTFKVFLPRAEGVAEEDEAARAIEASEAALHGSETILLVEDEKALRLVISEILGAAGYEIIHTASPTEAIAHVQTHQGRIHLLLTDVIMPEMNGRALAERIRSIRPDVKALFMSGYTAEVLGDVLDANTHLIEKPFGPEALLKKLRGMLAR
jgi:two-component system cell cycle sensor histidine kinase/response regulator CckA